ncbi:hypothetical protein AM10699_42990 [Acaryochloris marina MBIC10699]|nr:hypothetical protein AM10699_42990 [Acaryochloris marina MBIC10699]
MGHENLGMGGLKYDNFDGAIRFQPLGQHIEVGQHWQALNINRWVVEGDPSDGVFDFNVERGVAHLLFPY